MQPWEIIWRDIQLFFRRRRQLFALDIETAKSLRLLAERRQTSPHELVDRLVEAAVQGDVNENFVLQCWDTLSDRERQVAALICNRMTTKQIAAHMRVSPNTIKTYVERLMVKFHIHNRETLREMLAGYDLRRFE